MPHYEGPYFTIRAGGGFLYDIAGYEQDANSRQQIEMEGGHKLRDFRFTLQGRFPVLKRAVTWKAGIMYDGPSGDWLIRETGVMIAVPELWGYLFIGRAKEGFSLNKVMVGYAGWTQERATVNDAMIPILADGIKWLGYIPNKGFLWNVGWYHDWLSEGQSFSTYDSQFVARVAWLPVASETEGKLLHLGLNMRYGNVNDHTLRLRSRPETFIAPYLIDTGEFTANDTSSVGVEAHYRPGPLLFGTEYFVQNVDSQSTGNPIFHGGDVVATWLITGETRAYNTVGGYFKAVSPSRTVFEHGPGAWEAVLRYSYIDLDSGPVRGGRFWRITPMLNWHLSDNIRLELTYGYGTLDRFDLEGRTQFFQARLQLQL